MNYDMLKLENQLCFPLYVSAKEVVRTYKPHLDKLGITYTQYITLMALWEKEEIGVKDLGNLLYLDSGTLTPLLKKLESQGLIRRNRSAVDERCVMITLTKKGKALKEQAQDIPQKVGSCLPLSEDEATTLYTLLHKIMRDVR